MSNAARVRVKRGQCTADQRASSLCLPLSLSLYSSLSLLLSLSIFAFSSSFPRTHLCVALKTCSSCCCCIFPATFSLLFALIFVTYSRRKQKALKERDQKREKETINKLPAFVVVPLLCLAIRHSHTDTHTHGMLAVMEIPLKSQTHTLIHTHRCGHTHINGLCLLAAGKLVGPKDATKTKGQKEINIKCAHCCLLLLLLLLLFWH